MHYRPEIDGLRAVAVVSVILFHAGVSAFGGGFVGVDVFFVISGYLITGILLRELREGTFSIASFYERRIRRILPALFFVILCCFPFAWAWLLPDEFDAFLKSVLATIFFASNFWFAVEQDYFAPAAELSPLLHTWSLAVEEQYYIFFPLLLALFWRFGLRAIAVLIVSLGVISFLHINQSYGFEHDALFFLTWTRVWEILIGSLCGLIHFRFGRLKSNIGSVAGLLMIFFAVFSFHEEMIFPSAAALIPTFGTALYLVFSTEEDVAGKLLSTKLAIGIGLISYSAYLWHQPLMAFARLQFATEPSLALMLFLAALSLGLGWLSWRFVEKPFRSRSRMRWRTVGVSMGATCLVVIFLSALSLKLGFGLSRYDSDGRAILAQMENKPAIRYVKKRFNSLDLSEFDPSKDRKVMVIGDSYAQDFVNVLCEAGLEEGLSLSTHYISARCGNLFLDEDLTPLLAPGDVQLCSKSFRYDDDTVISRLQEADVIFLVSHWQVWQVPLLPESVQNISAATDAKVIVLGRKRFGRSGDVRFDPRTFLNRTDEQKVAMRTFLTDEDLMVNREMKESLPEDTYVDFQTVVSGDERSSPLFDKDANLISFDGSHLTRNGALFVGKRLLSHPLIQGSLQSVQE